MSDAARTRLASLGVLLAVFVAGGVLGAGLDRTLNAEPPTAEARDDRDDDRDDDDRPRRQALWERVEPSETQRTVIDSIIGHHRDRMESLQNEFSAMYNPRYWAIVDSTRNSIRSVFDEGQRARYDSLTDRYDRRAREDRSDDDRRDGESPDAGADEAGATGGTGSEPGRDASAPAADAKGADSGAAPVASATESRPDDAWVDRWVGQARRDDRRD